MSIELRAASNGQEDNPSDDFERGSWVLIWRQSDRIRHDPGSTAAVSNDYTSTFNGNAQKEVPHPYPGLPRLGGE
jgi:hypothetical protein